MKNRITTSGPKVRCLILGEMTFFTQLEIPALVLDKNVPPVTAEQVREAVKDLTIREIVGNKNERLANLNIRSINILDENIRKMRRIK